MRQNLGCYSHHDPSNLLADAVDRLERLNPHSPLLEAFSTNDDDATSQVSQMREQVYDLLEQAQEHGNRELQQAAVADLQRLVTISPANLEYRKVYAWALSVIGKKTEALEQAGILEQAGRTTHEFHFNLGQIFWLCGDPTKGRHHLHLARELATTEQERQDADERIADLTGQELT